MYCSGEGVQQNLLEAARWWQKAADQGNANGHFMLGRLNEQQGEYQAAILHCRAGQAASPETARNCIRRCVGDVVRAKQEEQEEQEEQKQEKEERKQKHEQQWQCRPRAAETGPSRIQGARSHEAIHVFPHANRRQNQRACVTTPERGGAALTRRSLGPPVRKACLNIALRWLGGHGCRMWEEDTAGRTPLMHAQGADQRATSSFLEHAPRTPECTGPPAHRTATRTPSAKRINTHTQTHPWAGD
jgi:hypothetical protein